MRPQFTPEHIERFWHNVDCSGGPDACWPWKLSTSHGYGQWGVWRDGKTRMWRTHRVAFYLTHGRWAKPCTMHTCDNRPCCNPAHLQEGTVRDNHMDALAKGRGHIPEALRGSASASAKLSAAEHRLLMGMRGAASAASVAKLFGVHCCTVYRHWKGSTHF